MKNNQPLNGAASSHPAAMPHAPKAATNAGAINSTDDTPSAATSQPQAAPAAPQATHNTHTKNGRAGTTLERQAVLEERCRIACLDHPVTFSAASASLDSVAFEIRCLNTILEDLSETLLGRSLHNAEEVRRVQNSLAGIEQAFERLAETLEDRPENYFPGIQEFKNEWLTTAWLGRTAKPRSSSLI